MGEKTAQALERIAYVLEGEESEGALMRIADIWKPPSTLRTSTA